MWKTFILFILFWSPLECLAETQSSNLLGKTHWDGREVFLYKDGTWKYGERYLVQVEDLVLRKEGEYERHYLNEHPYTGKAISYHHNGKTKLIATLKDGLLDGDYIMWHENGQMEYKGQFALGKEHGNLNEWDQNGKIIAKK